MEEAYDNLLLVLVCSLHCKLLGKVKNMLNSDQQQIKICFMLVPVSGMVILASVELSGELMQETKFDTGTSLEQILICC